MVVFGEAVQEIRIGETERVSHNTGCWCETIGAVFSEAHRAILARLRIMDDDLTPLNVTEKMLMRDPAPAIGGGHAYRVIEVFEKSLRVLKASECDELNFSFEICHMIVNDVQPMFSGDYIIPKSHGRIDSVCIGLGVWNSRYKNINIRPRRRVPRQNAPHRAASGPWSFRQIEVSKLPYQVEIGVTFKEGEFSIQKGHFGSSDL